MWCSCDFQVSPPSECGKIPVSLLPPGRSLTSHCWSCRHGTVRRKARQNQTCREDQLINILYIYIYIHIDRWIDRWMDWRPLSIYFGLDQTSRVLIHSHNHIMGFIWKGDRPECHSETAKLLPFCSIWRLQATCITRIMMNYVTITFVVNGIHVQYGFPYQLLLGSSVGPVRFP